MTTEHLSPLLIGLDVGSTAVKLVVLQPDSGQTLWRAYARHESRPADKARELLAAMEQATGVPPERFQAFVTGSAGAAIAERIGARHVQEVAAIALAVERRHPEVRAIVELGGQDAKIIQVEEAQGSRRTLVSMNDKCAGGTGAVIDKIAAKLKIAPADVGELRHAGFALHPVAGKCGIFAETDINGLQKRGVPAGELMASLFEAIVLQNLGVLARGGSLQPPVILLGGPNAFVRGLQEAWRTHLARLWEQREVDTGGRPIRELVLAPDGAEYYGALGAIDAGAEDETCVARYRGAEALADEPGPRRVRARGAPALASPGDDLATFMHQYQPRPFAGATFQAGDTVQAFIGLDAGSTSTKAVLLSEEGRVLARSYQLSRGNPIEDALDMFRALRHAVESQQAQLDVQGLVTTGYAKDILRDVFLADGALVETVAHARSALHCCEDPHVIVDVGGQDIKIIVLRDGVVQDFRLNTQCSAGNGYFLQAMAASFGYPVERFAELAFSAREMPVFSYGCVLFLQNEIANVQRQGWQPEEILAGLAAVLPRNVFLYVARAPNLARLGSRFVLQGGTQRNLAAVKAQVDFIRANFHGQGQAPEIVVHEHCGEAGAIGAALEAVRVWREGRVTSFIGLDAAERIVHEARSGEETRCRFCRNACMRTFIDVGTRENGSQDRRRLIVATCEKGAAEDASQMRDIRAALDAVRARTPNLVAFAAREAWKPRRPPRVADAVPARAWSPAARARAARMRERPSIRIGIPRVFNLYALAPLFSAYLESLGVPPAHIVYSDVTSPELYRAGSGRGAIDPCFPSKIALAHVEQLVSVKHRRTRLDAIFFPMIDDLPSPIAGTLGNHACPTVALTPQTVRAAYARDETLAREGIRYLDPLLNLADRALVTRQMFEAWRELLGLGREEHGRAIEAGFAALTAYESALRRHARDTLDALERDGRVGIVLLGRPYHHDPGLNHGIPEELQKLGYPVLSQSTLPLDPDLLDRLFGDEVRAGVISDPLDISDVWKNAFSASSNLKIWAAKFTARHPNLVAVELSNFKCGHDAPIYSVVQEIIESSGTPYFAFKDIDENRPAGAIRLRVETIHYALQRLEQTLARRRRSSARIDRWLEGYERRLRAASAPGPVDDPGSIDRSLVLDT